MFGVSKPPVVDFPGIPNYLPSTVNGALENSSDCFQELERINKEIESVKNEVEKEQRRLSRYQTEQVDGGNTVSKLPSSKSETTCKYVNGDSCKQFLHRRTQKSSSQTRKYVVDNSKPRTDLEYDPLSNFSADLRSYSSTSKDHKAKAGVKRKRDALCSDQKNPQSAREPSPVGDDLLDEGILIIDIPSSPEKKSRDHNNPCETYPIKHQDMRGELMEASPATTTSDRPIISTPTLNSAVFKGGSSPLILHHKCESQPIDVFDGLSKCLEDLRSENQRRVCTHAADPVEESSCDPEVTSLSEVPGSSKDPFQGIQEVEKSENSLNVLLSHAYHTENMNPAQPQHDPQISTLPSKYVIYADYQHHLKNQKGEQQDHSIAPHYWSPTKSVPSVVPCGQAHGEPPPQYPSASAALDAGQSCPLSTPSAPVRPHSANHGVPPALPAGQPSGAADACKVIVIVSSSDGEDGEKLGYSEMDISDSDPMEECYRIFMEADKAEKAVVEPSAAVKVADVKLEAGQVEGKPQVLPGQKRVAHVPKRTEPVAISRPQPQVLIPLRGHLGPSPSSYLPNPSKIQQMQQRTVTLTASVKGGQTFVSSTYQRRSEAPAPAPPTSSPTNPPLAVQNAYMNCIPVGNTLIQLGSNVHFILPEGSYPLPISSIGSSVSSVLTPITPVNTSSITPMQSFQLSTVTPVHRYRPPPAAPVNIVGNAPSLPSVSALGHASSAGLSVPQGALHVPPKPMTKRKVKQRPERVKDKVPHDVRQRYVNVFTEEFLKTSAGVKEAFEKALAEERTVYNRSVNKLKYLSVAVNALKRLKNHSAVATKGENETSVQTSKGNVPLNVAKLGGSGDAVLYESLKEYILNEEKLVEHNYPLEHPEKPGSVILFADNKKGTSDPLKRICCRCGATYSVSNTGKHTRKEECNYHYGKGVEKKVPGGVETRYSCCEGVMGAPGCQVFSLHVHDAVSLDSFVSSQPREVCDKSCPGVYSLDCEMCYTTQGLELSRLTMINSSLQVVYDTFVRPDNEVIDFNTRFSGVSETDLKGNCPSIGEVRQTLLRFVKADTILIGHGLETNLCALKLLHGTVVDTSVVFPHRLGPPHKLTLNNLTADYLRRIIQDSVCGHDTADDAAACMELLLWKVKEDGKGRK